MARDSHLLKLFSAPLALALCTQRTVVHGELAVSTTAGEHMEVVNAQHGLENVTLSSGRGPSSKDRETTNENGRL